MIAGYEEIQQRQEPSVLYVFSPAGNAAATFVSSDPLGADAAQVSNLLYRTASSLIFELFEDLPIGNRRWGVWTFWRAVGRGRPFSRREV
jgi:hypothetical protein